MRKEVKQYGLDIVVDENNEYYLEVNEWGRVENKIVKAIEAIGKEYGFTIAGFMFQEDVTEQYRQQDL